MSAAEPVDAGESLIFATMCVISIGTAMYVNLTKLRIPYTVAMFLLGSLLGLLSFTPQARSFNEFCWVTDLVGSVSPSILFHVFLPVLIFEGSYGIKPFALGTTVRHALWLAGPGLLINATVIAVVVKNVLYPEWSWYACLLLGSILSATDPVAVVTLLKDLGINANLTALVDAEALLNDGTALICFTLLLPATQLGYVDDNLVHILLHCLWLTAGACVFGLSTGFALRFALHRVQDDPASATLLTVAFAFMAYHIADTLLATSGVLTLFFAGTYLARNCPSRFPGSHTSNFHIVWHFLVHTLNTMLFSLVGFLGIREVWPIATPSTFFVIVFMNALCFAGRFGMITILSPAMNRTASSPFRIGMKEIALLSHSGLRGGVAMIMALDVADDPVLPSEVKKGFVQICWGLVFFTITVNATTCSRVVDYLGLHAKPQHRIERMQQGAAYLRAAVAVPLAAAKVDAVTANSGIDWQSLELRIAEAIEPSAHPEFIEETSEVVFASKLMRAFKTFAFALRDDHRCSEAVLVALSTLAQSRLATGTLSNVANDFRDYVEYPPYISYLAKIRLQWADEAKHHHDQFCFELMITYREVLSRLEAAAAEDPSIDEAAFGLWLERERQEVVRLVRHFIDEKPLAGAALFTTIVGAKVLRRAGGAAGHLHHHQGFSQFETGVMMAPIEIALDHLMVVVRRAKSGSVEMMPSPSIQIDNNAAGEAGSTGAVL